MASSGSSERAPKRPRTDEPVDEHLANSGPTNSSTVWFDDGSIVLQAENTRFRVHRTVMALNSPIFEDMLNIGQSRGEESVEDCPLVVLHDSAKDLETVLRALYDRRYFDDDKDQPFDTIASILRVSKKYDIQHLYEKALEYLTAEFPGTLDDWDSRSIRIPSFNNGHYFDVINLARELTLPIILPAAFYLCLQRYSCEQILGGIPNRTAGEVIRLSPSDQKVAIVGMRQVVCASAATTFEWLGQHHEVEGCSNRIACADAFHMTSHSIWKPFPSYAALCIWDVEWGKDMCKKCVAFAKRRHSKGREFFWTRLPECFDLPPWADS
ncbi:hypothetical protein PLICRDRAFT_118796 [Plicaturopsis crispa FD-325 SS-3]|uniref:BTB domain-containing protein n=1 Tax=Plicaturopsis crispa FD-325 SS-3 TaxID=944288 RepID=A0A0C9SWX8_PLICR|nr:hypothetical protein PLICRDRAFT_118796 [Plicaturopsis crispa FD-325 SS-3]